MGPRYEHKNVEEKWYNYWERMGYFYSHPDEKPVFSIVMPPPNVTGILHIGHVLNNTIQDVFIRMHRMLGYNVCWIPGVDHASIATEVKVMQHLREKNIDPASLNDQEFLSHVWDWVNKHKNHILLQLKKLGVSADWNRTTFTMDENYFNDVIDTFINLYNKGLIYRGLKMVNWDPIQKTAISDEEVIYKEEKGTLYFVNYPLVEGGYITVATTRPETIFADVAIAVNPTDERYKSLIGKKALVPIINREIPIILDEIVDKDFGTGALKVTPAHDFKDYEIGLKHSLPIIDIFNDDATVNEKGAFLKGLSREDARKKMIEALTEKNLLLKTQPIQHSIGRSERTGTIIEPRLSMQWFLKTKPLAEPAIKAVENGIIKIIPERFVNLYLTWMKNIKDWCISRQLRWGHPIPAYYCSNKECSDVAVVSKIHPGLCPKCQNNNLYKTKEVLDTWFSSWLWPISVLNGLKDPDNKDFKYYYPTNVLVTAPEILFFWVARMIMAGYEFTGKEPFKVVYLHGIVRDALRRKMSKSLGNSPDPLSLIDKYGADSLRFAILMNSTPGNDILFDESLCEQGQALCTKMWNAMRLFKSFSPTRRTSTLSSKTSNIQQEILQPFEEYFKEITITYHDLFKKYHINQALKTIYSFFWDDFCSTFLESIKDKNSRVLLHDVYEKTKEIFGNILKLFHPYIPFITEELWHILHDGNPPHPIIIAKPPTYNSYDKTLAKKFLITKKVITFFRNFVKESQINTPLLFYPEDKKSSLLIDVIEHLSKCTYTPEKSINGKISLTVFIEHEKISLYVPEDKKESLINLRQSLISQKSHYEKLVNESLRKLQDESFLKKAPLEVVEREKRKYENITEKIAVINEQINALSNL